MSSRRKAFVGIDVAIAKSKHLPVCVYAEGANDAYHILDLKNTFERPPAGRGNRGALDPDVRRAFASDARAWLQALERKKDVSIQCIAIDAPSDYCDPGRERRACEQALDQAGISCFATPTRDAFDRKIAESLKHLADGNKLSRLPNANQLWMLVGFDLFDELRELCECIETYPQAIVRRLGCGARHKSTEEGLRAQMAKGAELLGVGIADFRSRLISSGFGSRHDKLDAFFSAWVASLGAGREFYGDSERDAIWVPRAMD